MSRLTFQNQYFRCRLQCDRCNTIKTDGTRCKNRVCIGFPTCWIHSKQLYNVRVRPTPIGKGLFSTQPFHVGDWICPYGSEIISPDCLESRYPGDTTAPYAVTHDQGTSLLILDGACNRGLGTNSNGNFRIDGVSMSETRHNSLIEERYPGEIWLRARRYIPANTEIKTFYGLHYRLCEHRTYRTTLSDTRPC